MKYHFYSAIFILFIILAVVFLPWFFDQHIIYQALPEDYSQIAVAQEDKNEQQEEINAEFSDISPFQGVILPKEVNLLASQAEDEAEIYVEKENLANTVSSSKKAANFDYSQQNYPTIKFPIFNYHNIAYLPDSATITQKAFNVTPKLFEEHLKYFRENGYVSVPLDYLTSYFDTGNQLPSKVFAITFDDGRVGQYDYAFQLLKKYGFTATFFITVEWIDHVGYMSWDNVREMSEAGMVIGSHSMTHFSMTLVNADRLKWELEQSKKIIEEKINKPIDYLAYPGGSYNQSVIDETIKAGYQGSLSVRKVIEQSPKWRYFISRFHADDNMESIISKLGYY